MRFGPSAVLLTPKISLRVHFGPKNEAPRREEAGLRVRGLWGLGSLAGLDIPKWAPAVCDNRRPNFDQKNRVVSVAD